MEPKLLVASLLSRQMLTFADAIVIAVVIFVAAFLLGLWCGRGWQRRRAWSHAADDPKRRAQLLLMAVVYARQAEHAASLARLGLPQEVPRADFHLSLRGLRGTPRSW
jgi:hypothetical protein